MRTILALAVALTLLLIGIGPESVPDTESCGEGEESICMDAGRLEVRVRGARGRILAERAAGFSFDDDGGRDGGEGSLDVVVRIEPAEMPTATVGVVPEAEPLDADRVYIGSLSQRELWVEVTDRGLERTRVYHRPAGEGWGLVDVMPRSLPQQVARLEE